jgi:hypothetical protein
VVRGGCLRGVHWDDRCASFGSGGGHANRRALVATVQYHARSPKTAPRLSASEVEQTVCGIEFAGRARRVGGRRTLRKGADRCEPCGDLFDP